MVRVAFPSSASLRALELCVGAGGLALAAGRAGFADITAIDVHGSACETLRKNKASGVEHVKGWDVKEADIREVNFAPYADIDMLSGGPPCQPFSFGGERRGRDDSREMFPQFVRAVREAKPKVFMFENVRGILGPSTIAYFHYILQQLQLPEFVRDKGEKWKQHRARLEQMYTSGKVEGTQYRVIHQPLNGADFGVPQQRARVFIVGVRADLRIEYNFPLATHSAEALLRDQWVTGEYWERHKIPKTRRPEAPASVAARLATLGIPATKPWSTVREAIAGLPNVGLGRRSRKIANHFFNPGARSYPGHDGSPLDAPSKTIKAGRNGVPGGENMVRLDDGSVRYFTVRECARLQTFPDEWTFDGSWCGCMRQIGNAVPVSLGQVVVAPLAEALRARAARAANSPA
jgi:DNA (cytosine-5)-methyltransferase 1